MAPLASDHVPKQHVLSQVILRRFTWDKPPAGVGLARMKINRPDPRLEITGPLACGKVDNYIRFASRDAEKMWGRMETNVPKALKAVEDGSIFNHLHLVKVIKDLITLHLIRSKEAPIIHRNAQRAVSGALRSTLHENAASLRILKRRATGLDLPGRGWIDAEIDQWFAPTQDMIEEGFLFRSQQERWYPLVRSVLAMRYLRFLTTTEELLIGDVPAVPVGAGGLRYGLANGVGVGSAERIIMPLGRHLVVMTDAHANSFGQAPPESVEWLNHVQVEVAKDEVYFHPKSGLEGFVRAEPRLARAIL